MYGRPEILYKHLEGVWDNHINKLLLDLGRCNFSDATPELQMHLSYLKTWYISKFAIQGQWHV